MLKTLVLGTIMNNTNNNQLLIKIHASEQGISVIEAVVAAFIVAIGFISIYNLSSVITQHSINSIEREKTTMLATGMMEDLEVNSSNLAGSNYAQDLDLNTSCSKFQNSLLKHEKHLRRWCINLTATKGGLGTKLDADTRNIYVRTIQKNNRNVKILTFEFSSKGGKAKKIIRKIINEKQ